MLLTYFQNKGVFNVSLRTNLLIYPRQPRTPLLEALPPSRRYLVPFLSPEQPLWREGRVFKCSGQPNRSHLSRSLLCPFLFWFKYHIFQFVKVIIGIMQICKLFISFIRLCHVMQIMIPYTKLDTIILFQENCFYISILLFTSYFVLKLYITYYNPDKSRWRK